MGFRSKGSFNGGSGRSFGRGGRGGYGGRNRGGSGRKEYQSEEMRPIFSLFEGSGKVPCRISLTVGKFRDAIDQALDGLDDDTRAFLKVVETSRGNADFMLAITIPEEESGSRSGGQRRSRNEGTRSQRRWEPEPEDEEMDEEESDSDSDDDWD